MTMHAEGVCAQCRQYSGILLIDAPGNYCRRCVVAAVQAAHTPHSCQDCDKLIDETLTRCRACYTARLDTNYWSKP